MNREIEGYNAWFAFERQCAMKYVPLDKLTFKKKEPLVREDVLERLPLLPVA